jgi:hypothetical protein
MTRPNCGAPSASHLLPRYIYIVNLLIHGLAGFERTHSPEGSSVPGKTRRHQVAADLDDGLLEYVIYRKFEFHFFLLV